MTFDKELSQQHENWKKEYECLEQYGAKKNDRHKSLVKELQDLLSNEKRESKHLKDQIAEYRRYLKDELNEKEKLLQVESDKVKNLQARLDSQLAEERAASDAAQSRARHEAETLGEQLDQKGRMIHELDEQVQNLTDTIEQTRLALNRTRNELTEEKRRARQGLEESVTKSQQLEFVQQQCARLQEQLHDMTVITWKPEPIFRTGKDVEDEAEYETPEKFTTRTESDLTEKVECAQQ
jgi:predicted  nucleic acid-binding Zn-ribbon protein